MAHSEKCPLCDGSGRVRCDPNLTYPEPTQTCHGCYGKGWIEVMDVTPSSIPLQAPESPVSG